MTSLSHEQTSNGDDLQSEVVPSSKRLFGIPYRSFERRKTKQKVEINPRGLTLLYSPAEPQVDFVFVHGLRGGSVKTWCADEDLNLFWPKKWIAADEDFKHRVRTSSFGYANDWLTSQSSQLTLHDFGRDLIHQLDNSPYLRREQKTPIVLIGHSMGGLVIKKAYLLAHQQKKNIANRIKCIVFLATPHRGSISAERLDSLLNITGCEKAYVENLRRNSGSLQVINDEFRTVARQETLRLWTFYETLGTFSSQLIVDQDSAVLGYDGEEVNMLFADHRSICKFSSPQDDNYRTLRNTLLAITDSLTSERHHGALQKKAEQMKSIETYLNIGHSPQSDLDQHRDLQIEESCAWLEARAGYQVWRDGALSVNSGTEGQSRSHILQRRSTMPMNGRCSIYWLTGKPGAGKSICAAHVITRLQSQKRDCSYHFFRAGDKSKSSVSAMLLSFAFQMAEMHPTIRKVLMALQEARNIFDEDDDGAIWRKLFVNSILKSDVQRPQYWVIDGVDECTAVEKLFLKLHAIESSFDLRIFMTSRQTSKLEALFKKFKPSINRTMDSIQSSDTQIDMKLYLKSRLDYLPVDDPVEKNALVERLLAKANDCFLWLKLVSQELEGVYSEESIGEVLKEVPLEMSELYQRSIQSLHASKRKGDREVAKAVLIWTTCSVRPLTLEELVIALNEYDTCKIPNLKAVIEGPCSGLLLIDSRGFVQLVHTTAREYVLGVLESLFNITLTSAHERLARACLRCLGKEMAFSRSRWVGDGELGRVRNRSVFASYASIAFSEHLAASSSRSDQLLKDVSSFLSSRVLAWIEHVATEHPSLYPLTRAAKNFKEFLKRRAKYDPPLGLDFKTLDDWSTDLIRLVAKFGRNLRSKPSTIHSLIPSVAPKQSRLFQAAKKSQKWLEFVGPASETWDDCISTIEYRESWGTALATGVNVFAIGMKSGAVMVYDQSTCQERLSVQHKTLGEDSQCSNAKVPKTVRLLAFDSSDMRLASASGHSICVWSMSSELLHVFPLQEPCVSLEFSIDQEELLAVTRSSRIVRWNLSEEDVLSVHGAYSRRPSTGSTGHEEYTLPRQAPLAAAISPDQSLLALLYRGRPIYLCCLEDDTILGQCGRDAGSKTSNISVQTALFNPNPELNMLAVAYQDGELAIYDVWTQKELVKVDGDAYSLAATPDGRTLGSGNTRGTIHLWDFETLCLLYSIKSGIDEVRRLSFTGDGLRVVDIRDSRTKIWEPSALVRQSTEEDASMSDAAVLDAPVVGANDEIVSITAMCADETGEFIFTGRDDGSVVAYEVNTGLFHSEVHRHARRLFVTKVAFQSGLIASGDGGGRVIVRRLTTMTDVQGRRELSSSQSHLLQCDVLDPVRQLLFSHDGSHLLIATATQHAVWDLQTGQQCLNGSNPDQQWVKFGQSLGVVTAQHSLQLHDWETLQQVTALPPDIPLDFGEDVAANLIQKVVAQDSGPNIVACILSHSDSSKVNIVGWSVPPPASTDVAAQSARPFSLELPARNIKTLVGLCSDLIIFLDPDLWICSVRVPDLKKDDPPKIQQHFFIPPDFVSGTAGLRAMITQQRHIIFAKGSELAVVKGGLSWDYTSRSRD